MPKFKVGDRVRFVSRKKAPLNRYEQRWRKAKLTFEVVGVCEDGNITIRISHIVDGTYSPDFLEAAK